MPHPKLNPAELDAALAALPGWTLDHGKLHREYRFADFVHAFALDPYLQEPQAVREGKAHPTEVPGTGMRFDEAALAPFRG